jgi:predicted transcriptional regulator of viral defense system
MGKTKYLSDVEILFKKSPVVNSRSIERIVKNKKNIKGYTKQLIRNLILKNKIKVLTKGYYTAHDEPSLAVFCFGPAYLGLQDSLSIHNLWEQETVPIIITTRKVRQGIRKVLGSNVLIRRIEKKYFLGFEYLQQGNFYMPYSDVEKTLIDMIYFRQKFNEETIKCITEKIDSKKLKSYLKNYPEKFRKKVLRCIQ